MKDKFYSDNRDLVKWAVLHRLAKIFDAQRILQIAYYRPSEFAKVIIGGDEHDIPREVLSHFRDLRKVEQIDSQIRVSVLTEPFESRNIHLKTVKDFLTKFQKEKCVVFLDPDTACSPKTKLRPCP